MSDVEAHRQEGAPPRIGAWLAMYSLLVNSSSEKPQRVTKMQQVGFGTRALYAWTA
jgi:hypothetical protein